MREIAHFQAALAKTLLAEWETGYAALLIEAGRAGDFDALVAVDTPEDREACRKACHSLRGACGTLGVNVITEAAQALDSEGARVASSDLN